MSKTKRLAFMAVLTAVALTVFVIEAQLPTLVPVPGVKPGLANVITLAAMLLLGRLKAIYEPVDLLAPFRRKKQ